MAKSFWKEKWRKRALLGTAAVLSFSLALGTLSACKSGGSDDEEEDDPSVSRTDTQLIKNGDFEFYSEMDTEQKDKRAFINSPNNWSFTSGSPSSDTTSGIINVAQSEWDSYTKSTYPLVSDDLLETIGKDNLTTTEKEAEKDKVASTAISNAVAHWEEASVYDRLQFFDVFDDQIDDLSSSSSDKKFLNDYNYSIDFEDVEKLREELGGTVKTHHADNDEKKDENSNVLMIHNKRTSDNVRGTGQYYTSSTTVTLKPGTAAKVSVWVKTSNLYHFYADGDGTPVTRASAKGGAYISVTNTVGSTTLDQMRIENIRSPYPNEQLYGANNGWIQYSLFVRGSTFADSTFRIVLGLGQSTSSNRYEAVDGYALFDDLECTVMSSADYETASATAGIDQNSTTYRCTIDSEGDEKIFNAKDENGETRAPAYALDLYAGFTDVSFASTEENTTLTEEFSGTKKYTSLIKEGENDVTGLYNFEQLSALANTNSALGTFFEKDFKDAFPFEGANANREQVVMLLSTKGAAYTSTLTNSAFSVPKDSYKLVSFFAKTSDIRAGSGASATLIDEGGNKTSISAFDSRTLATTDIDNNTSDSPFNKDDIYNGWVQCFFFVENSTEKDQTFTLELHFGTTSVATATNSDYDDGWAAFSAFETHTLSEAQYGYAATNSRAVKVSLTDDAKDSSSFDSAASTSDIKNTLAKPTNFQGFVSTNDRIDIENGTKENAVPEGVYTGLLKAEHAETYRKSPDAWSSMLTTISGDSGADAQTWWNNIFSDASLPGRVSNQPLVILNTNNAEANSYGYLANAKATVSANSYQKISMRVKLSKGATAYFYLNDASDVKKGFADPLSPAMAKVTYWYDNEGNICRKDPSDEDFNKKNDVLFYLETNGLYTKAGETEKVYYANLHNYDKDEQGNLVTSDDGTIAYFYNEKDETFYAYYDKKKDVYSQPVKPLPTDDGNGNSIVHYTVPEDISSYGSVISVTGTDETEGKWVEVSFFIRTGSEAKTYRLELWAGSRDNKVKIPANSYFFFDSYSSADASSNYSTLLAEKIANMKSYYNKTNNLTPADEGYLGTDTTFPEDSDFALYYTFTFFDAPWYLRYDETTDTDKEGNPYANYKQSEYDETLVYFAYDNANGTINAKELPSASCFIDYSAYDVTVERSTSTDDDHDHDNDNDTTNGNNNSSNIWLILSSILLAVALVFAIGVVVGRRVIKHLKQTGRISSTKKPKKKKKAPVVVVKEEPVEEPDEKEEEDPNDPYNE